MAKNRKLNIQDSEITVINQNESDFISLTDIAKHKDSQHTDTIIQNWMRNRNTIELLGFWEAIYNPNFKPIEFEGFKKQAGLNSFVMTPKRWRENNADKKGNIRDDATLEQLVVLSNMESINALLIQEGLSQSERLVQLNKVAITQMKSLLASKAIKKLKQ